MKTGRLILISLVFLCFLSFVFDLFADDSNKVIEQKKAAIMKIMRQGQFKVHNKNNREFCAVFLDDFTKQKGIEHIKPIVAVDNYDDSRLQAYLGQCPQKEFHKNVEIRHAQTLQEIVTKEQALGRALTDKELEEYGGIEFYASKNFRLYRTNIDNNSKNGDEYVFYAEGYKNIADNYTYGGYTIIDFKKCKRDSGVPTSDPFDYEKQKPIENYSGIIKYKNKYYVFELKDWEENWALFLTSYNKKHKKCCALV